MLTCDIGHVFAARHPGQLVHPEVAFHTRDLGSGTTAPRLLPDDEVAIREGRDLRQMCDAENLVLGRQFGEDATDTFRDRPANARIDLIEDDHHIAIRTTE